MTISPIYPVQLQNGTLADAGQVMANFNQIQQDVNANAAHNGANTDITSLLGLTTPLPISEGGTGAATAAQALINLGVTAALALIVAVPIGGSVIWNSATNIPTGFAEENGQALSRTTYSALFNAIGTTWGIGDGSTTFNIPDSRGQFTRGWDDGRGIDPTRGFGSTQIGTIQSHNHGVTDPFHSHTFIDEEGRACDVTTDQSATTGGVLNGTSASPRAQVSVHTQTAQTGITINNTGGTETRPTNIARMYIIRVQ